MKKGLKGLFLAIVGVLALSLASCGGESSCAHKNAGTEWKKDTANHWHECPDCDEMVGLSLHDYGDWVVTEEADHDNSVDGSRYRVCKVCGFKFTEAIKAMPVFYLKGSINGWSDNEEYKLTINGTTETITGVVLAVGDEFKISTSDWSNQVESGNLDEAAKEYFGGDGNIKCLVAGTYTFVVTDALGAKKLSVIKTA